MNYSNLVEMDLCIVGCEKPDTVGSMVLVLRAALVQRPVPLGTHNVYLLHSLKAENLDFSDHLIFPEFCAEFPLCSFSAFVNEIAYHCVS